MSKQDIRQRLIEADSLNQQAQAKISAALAALDRLDPAIPIVVPGIPPGHIGAPAADIQAAIDDMRPGDTLEIDPGVVYGAITIEDKPGCTIKARVPGETRISGLWADADRGETAWREKWGCWFAKHGDSHLASFGDDFLFRYGGDRPVDLLRSLDIEIGNKTYKKPTHGYAYNNGEVFLRLPDDQNPNGKSVKMCDKPAQTIIRVENSPGLTLEGLHVEGAGDTDAILFDAKSKEPRLRNMVFTHCRRAARLPHGALVEWSEYTYDGFWRFYQQLVELNGEGTAALFKLVKKHWKTKGAALEGGMCESIYRRGSTGCEFRYNFMHSTFDGQRLGAFPGVDSHHNVYWRNVDNHFEMEHWAKESSTDNIHEHHSLLLDCPAGACSHQDSSGGMIGDHWVSHSIIANRGVHGPFLIKLKDVKGRIAYAHSEFVFKYGWDESWKDKTVLAQGMQDQPVPDNLKIYNCVLRGDQPDRIQGNPVMKGIASTRGTVEAVDMPRSWPIEQHGFVGPDAPDDLTDWPRPMRRVFAD